MPCKTKSRENLYASVRTVRAVTLDPVFVKNSIFPGSLTGAQVEAVGARRLQLLLLETGTPARRLLLFLL